MILGPEDVLVLTGMRAFALAGKVHFESEKSFVLTDSEKSSVNCHSALKGKGLTWIWIPIFNTLYHGARGKLYVIFSACAILQGEANTTAQRNEAPHLHTQLFQDLPRYRLLMGVIFLLTHQYPVLFLLYKLFSLPPPLPFPCCLCAVYFSTLYFLKD